MIEVASDERGVATVTLARAQSANALSGEMLRRLLAGVRELADSPTRVVCLRGDGKHFCAGADVGWMRQCAEMSAADNTAEAKILADLLFALHSLPQPLLLAAHGACYGGGAGLAAVADICIAAAGAKFCFSEVRLGLIPATIAPFVVRAVGERQAQRYFLNGAEMSAAQAQQVGLVHRVVADENLDAAVEEEIARLLAGGEKAQRAVKNLMADLRPRVLGAELGAVTAAHLARCRAGEEAREGVAAFLQKRQPKWATAAKRQKK